MVGAARRLATELVVIIASATHEIHWVVAARLRAVGTLAEPPADTSAALTRCPDETLVRPLDPPPRASRRLVLIRSVERVWVSSLTPLG